MGRPPHRPGIIISTAVKASRSPLLCFIYPSAFLSAHYGIWIYLAFFRSLTNGKEYLKGYSTLRVFFSAVMSIFCAKPNTHSALFVSSETESSLSLLLPGPKSHPSIAERTERSLHFVRKSAPQKQEERGTLRSCSIFGRWATLIGNGLNATEEDTDKGRKEGGGRQTATRRWQKAWTKESATSDGLGKLSQLLSPVIRTGC